MFGEVEKSGILKILAVPKGEGVWPMLIFVDGFDLQRCQPNFGNARIFDPKSSLSLGSCSCLWKSPKSPFCLFCIIADANLRKNLFPDKICENFGKFGVYDLGWMQRRRRGRKGEGPRWVQRTLWPVFLKMKPFPFWSIRGEKPQKITPSKLFDWFSLYDKSFPLGQKLQHYRCNTHNWFEYFSFDQNKVFLWSKPPQSRSKHYSCTALNFRQFFLTVSPTILSGQNLKIMINFSKELYLLFTSSVSDHFWICICKLVHSIETLNLRDHIKAFNSVFDRFS